MPTQGQDKWRNKYLDLIDESERAQKRFQERIDTLRRGLLQFSLEREIAFNWVLILISSIIIVFFLILCGLWIFCIIQIFFTRIRKLRK